MRLFFKQNQLKEISLDGTRIRLRTPRLQDYEAWTTIRGQSSGFLKPWEPVWQDDELTYPTYKARLKRFAKEQMRQTIFPFFVFNKSDGALMGGITLSQVRRGVSQSASIGYWMGKDFAGNGFMAEALTVVIGYGFGELDLHRIEAACIPSNHASSKLLTKTGFVEEGYVRQYLRINGTWQDHRLYSILQEDFAKQRKRNPVRQARSTVKN